MRIAARRGRAWGGYARGIVGLMVGLACGNACSESSSTEYPQPRGSESPTPPETTSETVVESTREGSSTESEDDSQPDPSQAADDRPDWLERLDDEASWARVASPSTEHAVARTEVVKILWDHTTDRVYFMQSERWPIHYDFALRFVQTDQRPLGTRRAFNTRQYLRPDREMQMASLVHYRDAGLWTLELGPADNLDGAGLVSLLARIRPLMWMGDSLRYRPRSELHRRRIRHVREAVRAIEPNAVWEGVRYQPVTLGEAVGRLRLVDGRLDPATVLPDQILVLDHVPNDIPLCAGIVTSEIQAPLAHVAVLSQSRGTPNMALRTVLSDDAFRALDDRVVRLRVQSSDYELVPATEAELRASLDVSRPAPLEPPALDATRADLTDTCSLRLDDTAWAGAKAAQLGEVCAAEVPTSGGFVVPVHHYLAHLSTHRIDASAQTLRAVDRFTEDGRVRARALSDLRARIGAADVDPSLVRAIESRVRRAGRRRWIFRSSTNAEDLPGFSGAGLYESVVTEASPGRGAIAAAVREVWASVWSRRAFDEREYYRVDHDAVAMAILVQPLVDSVVAMGVAITENPFSRQRSGILVNLAPPGGSVTAAEGEELPEQVLLYRHSRPEVLSRSTVHGGRPILLEPHMRPLRERLDRVHTHMMAQWGDRADAADIELALLADGTAVIVQARSYRLRR